MAKQLSRSVSIIGTSTFGQHYFDAPEMEGLSLYELWAYVCHQAMEDAGLKPKDIDKVVYSHMANFQTFGNVLAPVGSLMEWAGLRGKPIVHVEQACASGYISFMEACDAVASGKYDVVMVAGIESPKHFVPRNKPAYNVRPLSEYDAWWHPGRALFDTAYTRFDGVSDNLLTDENAKYYMQHYGVSEETIDDAYNAMAVNLRRGAAQNPRACERKEYADIARENGYDDVMDYMRSEKNPKITQHIRKSGSVLHNVAAGAIIVCASDIAERYSKKPIQVVDYASSTTNQRYPFCFHQMNVDVRDALLENGTSLDDLDLMITTVMTSGEQLDSTEVFGYLPEGQGYQYELDGRTAYDGDRPVNPHGGDLSFGHAFAVSGISMLSEAILQMRGEAGGCQVKHDVNRCLVRGMGGGHTTVGIVLEK